MRRGKKAQSTLEYIILFTVIILAIIFVVNNATMKAKIANLFGNSTTEGAGKKLDQAGQWLDK